MFIIAKNPPNHWEIKKCFGLDIPGLRQDTRGKKEQKDNQNWEWMRYEKLILVSKSTSMTGIVEKEICGLSVDCNSVDEIRNAIVRLKADPDLCHQLGANGRSAYEERYSWEIMEKWLLAIYRELTGGHT